MRFKDLFLAFWQSGIVQRASGKPSLVEAFNSQTGRWELTLQGGKGSIRVRPENVVPLESASHVSESDIPEEFRCVITRELMERPVITSDGHTYERSAIAKWLEEHNSSPKTGRELPDKVLKPNHALRAQIMAFRELFHAHGQGVWLAARKNRLTASRFACACGARGARKTRKAAVLDAWCWVHCHQLTSLDGDARDGLCVLDGMPEGLLEIKTSPSWDDMFEGEVPVDWTYQVNGCMKVASEALGQPLQWCDLFLWTPRRQTCRRLLFDEELWERAMFPELRHFFFEVFLPEALERERQRRQRHAKQQRKTVQRRRGKMQRYGRCGRVNGESRGLPPLPPWEPESQEVVQPPRPSQPNQGLQIQSHTIMQRPESGAVCSAGTCHWAASAGTWAVPSAWHAWNASTTHVRELRGTGGAS
eukprot:s922_g26.t1